MLFHNEIEAFHGSKPGVGNSKEDVHINNQGLNFAKLPVNEAKAGVFFTKKGMDPGNVAQIGVKKTVDEVKPDVVFAKQDYSTTYGSG